MKRYIGIIILVLIIFGLIYFLNESRKTNNRLKANQISLYTDTNTHVILTKKELKKLELYKHELDSLKIRPNKVKRVTVTDVIIQTDTFLLIKTKEVVKYKEKDYQQYSINEGCLNIDVLATEQPILLPIKLKLKIQQYEYYKRRKIWFLRIGKKYLETTIVSNCEGANITSEVIEVVK